MNRRGYTLAEMMIATALTLVIMAAVVRVFALLNDGIITARSGLEMTQELSSATTQVQKDLKGATALNVPGGVLDRVTGYFEIVEGPIGPVVFPWEVFRNTAAGNQADTTAGDNDDILAFTVRSRGQPFVGRHNGAPIESYEAEIVYFVRGRKLYRQMRLIKPTFAFQTPDSLTNSSQVSGGSNPLLTGFNGNSDLSVRIDRGLKNFNPTGNPEWWSIRYFVASTLDDLARRENRLGHCFRTGDFPINTPYLDSVYPFALGWGQLGMPTLREYSDPKWKMGEVNPANVAPTPKAQFDLWESPYPWDATEFDRSTGTAIRKSDSAHFDGPRVAEDVLLNHVLSFDVKVWDSGAPLVQATPTSGTPVVLAPGDMGYIEALRNRGTVVSGVAYVVVGYGAYVDLNYMCRLGPMASPNQDMPNYGPPNGAPAPQFHWAGNVKSGLRGTEPSLAVTRPSTYDTWTDYYETDGIDEDSVFGVDQGRNGLDDNGDGVVDDPNERECPPPYDAPLRGIQIKIRVFEPSSRQIREVTVVQEFTSK
jgi:prepilin-type N-terminal cleavage/methylation domain-containing protein